MPEDAEFGALYRKLLDKHVAPDPRRSEAVLAAVLRKLSGDGPNSKACENGMENHNLL